VMTRYVTNAGIIDCDRMRRSFDQFDMYEVHGHGEAVITVKALGMSGLSGTMYRLNLATGNRPWNGEPWNTVKHMRRWRTADDDELLALHAVAVREFNLHREWDRCLFIEKALEFHGITEQVGAMAGIRRKPCPHSDDSLVVIMAGIIANWEASPYGKLLIAERDVFRPNGGQKDK